MTMLDLSLLVDLSGRLTKKPRVFIAGGMPRSGTTQAEAIVQSHPAILCFQEFMPLKSTAFADFLCAIDQAMASERSIWSDVTGRQWRGYTSEEDKLRIAALTINSLACTTNLELLGRKSLEDVLIVFCKTPGAELNLLALNGILDFSYVHCIRDPVACARSNWEMPWQSATDLDAWVGSFGRSLGESAGAFEAIQQAGIPTHVVVAEHTWYPATQANSLSALFSFLGIAPSSTAVDIANSKIDPWPSARRRIVPMAFEPRHADLLRAHEGTRFWSHVFEPYQLIP